MSDTFGAPTSIDPRVHTQGYGAVTYGGADDALWVEFYPRQVELGFASEQAGRPIYEERTYVKIVAPGSNGKTVNDREANESDKRRFPRHWAFYQDKNKDTSIIGTPLTECTFITRTLAEELKAVKIYTAEQLASLGDDMLMRLGPGFRAHKAKAVAHLDAAKTQAPIAKLAAENEALKQHNENLTNAVNDLMRRVEVMEREKQYQQPQQLPQHQQEQIEREVPLAPQERRPFFDTSQIPDARAAYQAQGVMPPPALPSVNRGGRPFGSKNRTRRKASPKSTTNPADAPASAE